MLETYFPNDYLRALIIFLSLLILLKAFISITERIVLRLVRKTKTNLDDILINKSSFPITWVLFFISLRFAVNEMSFSDVLTKNIHSTVYSGIAIGIGMLIYVFVDVIVFEAWKKVSKKAKISSGESLSNLMHGILKVVAIIFVILYVLTLWGIEITPLLAGLGVAGLAVALALQPILANIFSGVSMILDKSVGVGDLVNLDANNSGKIKEIGIRTTRIVTFDNELIIVPNSKLADSVIQNVALPEPKIRVVIPFSVAYGSDINKVKDIVLKEIKSIKYFTIEPQANVRFLQMADSSLNFKAYFYIDSFENKADAIDEANTRIYNTLRKNKIEIPFNQIDVHLKRK